MSSPEAGTEPFPALSPVPTAENAHSANPGATTQHNGGRRRASSIVSISSSIGRASRTASLYSRQAAESIGRSFMNSNPPLGMWQATGEVASQIPTLTEIKHGSFSAEGWSHEGQMERRGSTPHEIHRKRRERTSSATTMSKRSNTGGRTPGTIRETIEYFPAPETQEVASEAKRVPTTIHEGGAEM